MRNMIDLVKMLTLLLAVAALFFQAGYITERHAWEAQNMGDLCSQGYEWSCRLHPNCTMNALYCFDRLSEYDIERIERGLSGGPAE